MHAPAPDLPCEDTTSAIEAIDRDDDEARAEATKLEQLAERVSAARSVY